MVRQRIVRGVTAGAVICAPIPFVAGCSTYADRCALTVDLPEPGHGMVTGNVSANCTKLPTNHDLRVYLEYRPDAHRPGWTPQSSISNAAVPNPSVTTQVQSPCVPGDWQIAAVVVGMGSDNEPFAEAGKSAIVTIGPDDCGH